MTLWLLPDLLAAVLNLFFAAYVSLKSQGKLLHRLFVILILNLVVWELSECRLLMAKDALDALFWIKFEYVAIFSFPAIFAHFSLVFSSEKEQSLSQHAVVYLPTLLLTIALLFTDLIFAGVQPRPWGYGSIKGPFHIVFRIYFAAYGLLAAGLLAGSTRRAFSPIRRVQGKYFLAGLLVPIIFGVVILNILQPLGIHSLDVVIAPLATIPMAGIFAYAIVRYRLMDTEVILTRGITHALSFVLSIGPLLALMVWMQKEVFGTISYPYTLYTLLALTVAGLIFSRLAAWIQENVTQSLWKKGRSHQDIVNDFSKSIIHSSTIPHQQGIAQNLGQVLTESFAPATVYLLQGEKGARRYQTTSSQEEKGTVTEDAPLMLWLRAHDGIVVKAELELEREEAGKASLIPALQGMACEVCVPLKVAGRLTSFIAIVNKYNKTVYTLEDFRFLSLLANEAAIALENARLYEELKRSQELLARSDRLAAVGTLAAGIAHEIRNPLVSIHTFTQLLPERLDDPEFRTTFLQIANTEVARVSDLVNNLMTFARPSPSVIREVDLNAVLEQIVLLLGGQAKKAGISLTVSPSPHLPSVRADEGQVKQVFMNLLLNALQATPAGGTVGLATQALRGQGGKEYCRVEVRDTGAGIPPEHKEQIFDPFFTTKDSGTGLGLFIAHQIVAEHGGYIDIESAVGAGTSFYVYLPCAQAQEGETTWVAPDGGQLTQAHLLKAGAGKR